MTTRINCSVDFWIEFEEDVPLDQVHTLFLDSDKDDLFFRTDKIEVPLKIKDAQWTTSPVFVDIADIYCQILDEHPINFKIVEFISTYRARDYLFSSMGNNFRFEVRDRGVRVYLEAKDLGFFGMETRDVENFKNLLGKIFED